MTYSRRIRLAPMWVALALALAIVLLAFAAVPAFAHVHGITPLGECTADNGNSGASAAQGDPIGGLIPRDVGNAPLEREDGGL